jgi:hypothetical protein
MESIPSGSGFATVQCRQFPASQPQRLPCPAIATEARHKSIDCSSNARGATARKPRHKILESGRRMDMQSTSMSYTLPRRTTACWKAALVRTSG